MIRVYVVFLLILCSCGNNGEKDTVTADSAKVVATVEQKVASEAPSQPEHVNNNAGSIAGLYVESFAGANTHSYEFKVEGETYTGTYEEYQGNDHTKVILTDIVVNEQQKTVTFKQDGKKVIAKITDNGLEIDDEVFEKR